MLLPHGRMLFVVLFTLAASLPARSEPPAEKKSPPSFDRYGDPLPEGAIARMGAVRLRHENNGALWTAFADGGKVLATASAYGLRLWETASGRLLAQVSGDFQLAGLVPSADGKSLALREDESITIRSAETGRLIRRWPNVGTKPHLGTPLAFSPDGKLLVIGEPGIVHLWDGATGKELHQLPAHERGVASASFTGSRTLVTAGHDDAICTWDVVTGDRISQVATGIQPRRMLRLSHDGRVVAAAPYSNEAVRLLEARTGKERCRLHGRLAAARFLAFTPDDRILATSWTEEQQDQATISLWETATGKLVRRFTVPARIAEGLRFAPDGRTLLTTGGPVIAFWDSNTGKRLLDRPSHRDYVAALAYTPDGRTLVSAGRDGSIHVWDATSGRHERELARSDHFITPLLVLPKGEAVVTGGHKGAILLQHLKTGKVLSRFPLEEQPERVQLGRQAFFNSYYAWFLGLSPDARTLAAYSTKAGMDHVTNQYRTWDVFSGRMLLDRTDTSNVYFPDTVSLDGKIAARRLFPASPMIKGIASEPGGQVPIVVVGLATGRRLLTVESHGDVGSYPAFSPDNQTLLTETTEVSETVDKQRVATHMLLLWELRSARERLRITSKRTIPGQESPWSFRFDLLAFAPDGKTFATTRNDRTIQLWDVATGKELLRHSGYDSHVRRLAFSPDGKTLASGHEDTTILVWNVATAATRAVPNQPTSERELEAWWTDLAASDAHRAHGAIWEMIVRSKDSLPFLRNRLRPATSLNREKVSLLVRDLDSSEFQRREAAARQLAELAELAEPALNEALKSNPTPEQRRRINTLLAAPRIVPAGEKLRHLRAIEVLEYIGTPEAQELLKSLAQGAPEGRLTQEAKAALERLARRPAAKP